MTACGTATFTIFLGDNKPIYLRVNYAGVDGAPLGDPVDLTTCTEIIMSLPKADGTFAQLKLTDNDITIEDARLGKYMAQIDEVTSALLQVGPFQTFTVQFTFADDTIYGVDYYQGLSVVEPRPY